jgi:hypothetical protein
VQTRLRGWREAHTRTHLGGPGCGPGGPDCGPPNLAMPGGLRCAVSGALNLLAQTKRTRFARLVWTGRSGPSQRAWWPAVCRFRRFEPASADEARAELAIRADRVGGAAAATSAAWTTGSVDLATRTRANADPWQRGPVATRATGAAGHRRRGPPGTRATGDAGHRGRGPPAPRATGAAGHRRRGPPSSPGPSAGPWCRTRRTQAAGDPGTSGLRRPLTPPVGRSRALAQTEQVHRSRNT